MNGQIKIGPEYFKNIKRDYSNWEFAVIRELCQNSIDCGSNTITIKTTDIGNDTFEMVFSNDGPPMAMEVITEKLLSLGSTTKDGVGDVGGFGIAKSLIYFCHDNYTIETGNIVVSGIGGNYSIKTDDQAYFDGTRSTITIRGTEESCFVEEIKKFASFCNWNGKFVLNGVELNTDLKQSGRFVESEIGMISVEKNANNCFSGLSIVRVHGIPMFIQRMPCRDLMIVELSGSYGYLQSSRDCLSYPNSVKYNEFVSNLINGRPLENKEFSIHFKGRQVCAALKSSDNIKLKIVDGEMVVSDGNNTCTVDLNKINRCESVHQQEEQEEYESEFDFYIKSIYDKKAIPDYYFPMSFSRYSKTLIKAWVNIIKKIYEINEISDPFSVGFIFNDDVEAQFVCADGKQSYLINPVSVSKMLDGDIPQFFNRFGINGNSLKNNKHGAAEKLISVAVHEVCHKISTLWHNEEYSNCLTDMINTTLLHHDELLKAARI